MLPTKVLKSRVKRLEREARVAARAAARERDELTERAQQAEEERDELKRALDDIIEQTRLNGQARANATMNSAP